MFESTQHSFNSTLAYFAEQESFPLFFSPSLQAKVTLLKNRLPQTAISIYPDATLKSNTLPTGIVCAAKKENAMLMPFILRDPGCGVLSFKMSNCYTNSTLFQSGLGEALANLSSSPIFEVTKQNFLNKYSIEDMCCYGLNIFPELEQQFFSYTNFTQDDFHTFSLSADEKLALSNDFMQLTNYIELRKIAWIKQPQLLHQHSINENDLIGFIHSGSLAFPEILGARFTQKICESGYQTGLFTSDDIAEGIVGVPYCSPLGQKYAIWLRAAMNFALVSRYALYETIKQVIISIFPSVQIIMLNDNPHAGLFEKHKNQDDLVYSTRGVQHIVADRFTLLSGQRETPAALLSAGANLSRYDHWIAHGTGEKINPELDYTQAFDSDTQNALLLNARQAFYNTEPEYTACIPYSYNLHTAIDYFEKIKLAHLVTWLNPYINIWGASLKGS